MCYPKPGPRCSASAAARLVRAKHAAYSYFMGTSRPGGSDRAELDLLSKARDDAQREYDITPAGIKALERYAEESKPGSHALQKLEDARAERAARLRAVKAEDLGDLVTPQVEGDGHQGPLGAASSVTYGNADLSQPGATLQRLDADAADVNALLDESEAWVTKLTADEIEALHWYSQDGYAEINGSLAREDWRGGGRRAERVVQLLDSAIAKADSSKSAVVYRRHFFYNDAADSAENENEEGLFANLTFEEMAAKFPVGSTYEPKFYMSTSLNPSNIGMPMRRAERSFMVRLEILTHRGAALPAVSNSGTSEQEILLPRDAAYRVVGNDHVISIVSKGKVEQVRVIQLEELPVATA